MTESQHPKNDAAVSPDPVSSGEAVDLEVQKYADEPSTQSLDPETEKELGEVEQALEDSTLGIEDRT
ncbi:MAG: hypothetical protein ACFB4I_21805 [Cyanophyceae cyanobacterium]